MAKKLGILVTRNNEQSLDYVISLTNAARARNIDVQIFFTGLSVHLTQTDKYRHLVDKALIYVCDVSFRAYGYEGKEVPGVGFKQFVTQARNAEMLEETDKYLVF